MKKYFMKGTEDELQFGDMIELDLTEDLPNGKVRHHHLECKFIPELVPLLLEEKIIEVVEEKEKEEKPLDFQDPDSILIDELLKANQNLEHRVYKLEKEINKMKASMVNFNSKPHKNAKKAV